MKVTIKATGGTQKELEFEPSNTIADVKEKLVDHFNMPVANQRLIFRGRIVKDSDTLEALHVTDGLSMHLVRSAGAAGSAAAPAAAPAATPAATAAPTRPAAVPAAANPFAGLDPSAFAGLGGMPPMDPATISQMLQNPFMQQMMQNFMSNPELLRSMVSSNPLLQNMAQQNPAVREALNNPELLQTMMNPALLGGLGGGLGGGAAAPRAPAAAGGAPDLSSLLGGGGLNPDVLANMNRMMQDPATQTRINEMMQNMEGMFGGAGGLGAGLGAGAGAPAAGGNPEETFAAQLKQLEEMGFPDRDANLNALSQAHGDVNRAIAVLLERGFGN